MVCLPRFILGVLEVEVGLLLCILEAADHSRGLGYIWYFQRPGLLGPPSTCSTSISQQVQKVPSFLQPASLPIFVDLQPCALGTLGQQELEGLSSLSLLPEPHPH